MWYELTLSPDGSSPAAKILLRLTVAIFWKILENGDTPVRIRKSDSAIDYARNNEINVEWFLVGLIKEVPFADAKEFLLHSGFFK